MARLSAESSAPYRSLDRSAAAAGRPGADPAWLDIFEQSLRKASQPDSPAAEPPAAASARTDDSPPADRNDPMAPRDDMQSRRSENEPPEETGPSGAESPPATGEPVPPAEPARHGQQEIPANDSDTNRAPSGEAEFDVPDKPNPGGDQGPAAAATPEGANLPEPSPDDGKQTTPEERSVSSGEAIPGEASAANGAAADATGKASGDPRYPDPPSSLERTVADGSEPRDGSGAISETPSAAEKRGEPLPKNAPEPSATVAQVQPARPHEDGTQKGDAAADRRRGLHAKSAAQAPSGSPQESASPSEVILPPGSPAEQLPGPVVDAAAVLEAAEDPSRGRPDGAAAAQPHGPAEASPATALLETATRRSDSPAPPARLAAEQGDPSRFVQRVANAFAAMGNRDGALRLKLYPPELGSLRIEIKVKNGVLSARVEAETGTARSLLLDNLPALRQRLAAHDIKVGEFEVDLPDHSQQGPPESSHEEGRPRQHGGRRPASRIDSLPEEKEASRETPWWQLGGGDRLDVFI